MPTLSGDVLARYRRFSLYNSPYVAHDSGCAIDLYPTDDTAPSPVTGEVIDTRSVRAPPKEYAPTNDYLILVDTGEYVARMLHVEPAVEPGDVVGVGDSLGTLVRAGFFAPWVDNHIHLGFRDREVNPYRASGSLPIDVDVQIEALAWDGTGQVVEVGETYVVLDSPDHPAPGEFFVGIESECLVDTESENTVALDGGCPHYDGGGVLSNGQNVPNSPYSVTLDETRLGVANGRDVRWDAIEVRANGTPVTGLSFFLAQDDAFGAKVICPDTTFERGETVTVSVESE